MESLKQSLLEDGLRRFKFFRVVSEKIKKMWNDIHEFSRKVWEMGESDPRKIIFAIKMGSTLSLVSLLIFWKGSGSSHADITQYTIWAILTVIVMFEFSIGATFIKGFNRGMGTLCGGVLAFISAELSLLAGKWEEVIIVISIFLAGFFSSYLKLYPTMKPYEYAFQVFILTHCILIVAGNRNREYEEAVLTRILLIALGACACLLVNICVCPIWSGEDLHRLVVKNFKGVANSLEECVNGYLKCVEYERVPSKILTYQASDDPIYNGYRSVVESTSQEDALLQFALWEPPHGRYKMYKYPWKNYVKSSGALRHCAFTVMALHGCILSEIQVPEARRQVFRNELQRVGTEGAEVLRGIGKKVEAMEKLSARDVLKEVHEAAENLQRTIDQRSYLLVNSEKSKIGSRANEVKDTKKLIEEMDDANMHLQRKSMSETVLDLTSVYEGTPSPVTKIETSAETFKKRPSWPSPLPVHGDSKGEEFRIQESASALSLAAFASLMIEFVATLENVVDTFEELSDKAKFKDPDSGTRTT